VALPDGTFRGAPAFYIERGLGSQRWGMVFALLLIFTFGLAFNAVQANTIAAVLRDARTVPTQLSGIVLALLAAPAFLAVFAQWRASPSGCCPQWLSLISLWRWSCWPCTWSTFPPHSCFL
jgi:hypothetical protein